MAKLHESYKLDACSYMLHYSSNSSQGTISSPAASDERLTTARKMDILKAKTPEEIEINYQRLLVTKGKWNAEAYLKTLSDLRTKEGITAPRSLFENKTPTLKYHQALRRENAAKTRYQKITVDCEPGKKKAPKVAETPTLGPVGCIPPLEPAYKKIFKNAKLKRKPVDDKPPGDALLSSPSSHSKTETADEIRSVPSEKAVRKPCELMKDGLNNYLLDVRKSIAEKAKNKKVSFGSATEENLDDIEKYYQNLTMLTVLEDNLDEQLQMMKMSLKSHLTDLSAPNLLRETGYNELKDRCLNDIKSIIEFQNLFDDSRWRRKYELERLDVSDDANSLDVSEIQSSESDSLFSGDSLGSEMDYKCRRLPPSRIPYINEVQQLGDVLFDKISLKWEREVEKNFKNLDVKPYFRQFANEIRLRSTNPVYSELMKGVEPYDDIYPKQFVPLKYRESNKMEKYDDMIDKKHKLAKQRRELESWQIAGAKANQRPARKCEPWLGAPTKQSDKNQTAKNQRYRLKCIMRDVQHRNKEDAAWSMRTAAKDYAKLKPIIRRRNPLKRDAKSAEQNSLMVASLSSPRNAMSMRSINYFDTSTFFRPSAGKLKFKRGSKLAIYSGSKIRLPI